jgi:hypothetical protein
MALTMVAQKKWVYTLYQDEHQALVLSVLCGGVGMYELNIPLSDEDGQRALNDEGFLDGLAEAIRTQPQNYAEKSVRI